MQQKIDFKGSWQRYKKELLDTNRHGVEDFLLYLNADTDFKDAPASTRFHLAEQGGLCQHSLNVLDHARAIAKDRFPKVFDLHSTTLVCLLHDLCKANFYAREKKWVKENGRWTEQEIWAVHDQQPFGHGEKSAILANRYIPLQDDELAAIRWHMMGFDAGIHFNYPSGYSFRTSMEKYPLLKLLIISDMMAELEESL